jgi:hypothetical protein
MTQRHEIASAEQIQQQLEGILSSKHFRQAKSLERFLRYVVTKQLSGEEDSLKEYTLGVEVFQRGEGFDPRTDAVVRVQANMLRKKLAQYYESEGATDEIIIELPKGHYVPQYSRRLPEAAPRVTPTTGKAQLFLPFAFPRWMGAMRVAGIFVLGLLTAVALQTIWKDKGISRASQALSNVTYLPLWEKFLQPRARNIVAYGTPQFFYANGLSVRDVHVNSATEMTKGARLKAIEGVLKSPAPFTPAEVYTGVGETHGVYLLSKFLGQATPEAQVTNSRLIRWQELKNTNVIFISSMRFHTLAKELPFPNDFTINPGPEGKLINLCPQAGERTVYWQTPDDPVRDYAVITLWPGKQSAQRVMVLSGNTTIGTMAAAEYVTDPESLSQLYQQLEQCRLRHGSAQHAPYFQVLVRAEVRDNQPFKISYMTHHDLKIPDDSGNSLREQIGLIKTPAD